MTTAQIRPEDCPEPGWHETHRYCPACSWTEPTRSVQPSSGARAATTLLGWKHPNRGEQVETLCDEHLNYVRDALHALGIGCYGTPPDAGALCVRCNKVLPWRNYLAALDGPDA